MNLKFLKKNDVADVVFLGTAGTLDEVKKIKNFIKKIGLTPNIFLEKETTLKKPVSHEFPSFKASQRFEQFKKAVESDSKIIWCARGGYGSAELLPFLTKMKKPKMPKIFIGFSDISSLNNFFPRFCVRVCANAMLTSHNGVPLYMWCFCRVCVIDK